jgi:hypothetical protein
VPLRIGTLTSMLLQTNHNELALIGEPVSETKKEADFLEQISAPLLTTAKENILGDVAKLEDFPTGQQYLKQVLLPQKAWNTAASMIYAVGTKSNRRGCGGNAGDSGRKKKQKVSAIDTRHRKKAEFFKLPQADKD